MSDDLDGIRAAARNLIGDATEPDPHALVGDLLGGLRKAQRAALLQWAAGQVLAEANRWARASLHRAGTSWKTAVNVGELLAQRYQVDGVWIELGECSRGQVLTIAAEYRDRAAHNLARAEEFEGIARQMKRTGAATVAELFAAAEAAA